MCEDEPVRPRVSVSSEGSVLEGHKNDPKVVLCQWLLELTTRLYPGPVQKGLGYAPRASGARAQLAVILSPIGRGVSRPQLECSGQGSKPRLESYQFLLSRKGVAWELTMLTCPPSG